MKITVLMTTYNRCEELQKTLEAMCRVDRTDLDVEIVVIDNNSSDSTPEVVKSFQGQLPLRYLFESRQGKNCALNKALREVELGDWVVFTDDDVEPAENWLQEYRSVAERWPDQRMIGGKILNIWPYDEDRVPGWAKLLADSGWGLPIHDHGEEEKLFPEGTYPGGANYAVHKEVLVGKEFPERFGPTTKNRIMGSETSFIRILYSEGIRAVYAPSIVVGHRLEPELLELKNIKKRIRRAGKTGPHLFGIQPKEFYENHRYLWFLRRYLGVLKYAMAYLASTFRPSRAQRIVSRLAAIRGMAYNLESLKVARENKP